MAPNDSASQISEVVSEANLQDVNAEANLQDVNELAANRIYDMTNAKDVLDLMNDPTVVFGVNSAYNPADDLITFITPDASYEILRSTFLIFPEKATGLPTGIGVLAITNGYNELTS